MAFSYKTSIAFGLVYIPVKLHACVKNNDVGFNMLDKKTMTRVRYVKTCVDCEGREVKNEDIVKGFQYEKDKYVVFTDEDFEKVKTERDKTVTIEKFVDLAEIDPVYFDKSYYVEPVGGEKAFGLLLSALEEEGRAGVAKSVLGSREVVVVVRARDGKMVLNTLFFDEEIQKPTFTIKKTEPTVKEKALAKTLISTMEDKFDPADYKDEFTAKIHDAIAKKIEGKEVTTTAPEGKRVTAADLMEALTMSLENVKGGKSKAGDMKEALKKAPPPKAKPAARARA
jgi:Ku protein, prokaryotic